MDIRIGVTHSPRELDLELAEGADPAQVRAEVEAALAGGTVLWLTDRKGRQVGIPANKIAYIDLGSADAAHRIGFSG